MLKIPSLDMVLPSATNTRTIEKSISCRLIVVPDPVRIIYSITLREEGSVDSCHVFVLSAGICA